LNRLESSMTPLLLRSFTATSCIGRGLAATLASLEAAHSGLKVCEFETVRLATYVGAVDAVETVPLPASLRAFTCRNNRLAELGLNQDGFDTAVREAAARFGPRRVGVFLGTSTAGILETELAYRRRDPEDGSLPHEFIYGTTHNSFSVADYVRRRFGLAGPAAAVSCACASSAKAFASARRMIAADVIDAAVVGGVDSLCLTTLYGFHSLQLTSSTPCRPFDVARDGISIGEAAAFALLERPPASLDADAVLLLGVGESSDAHHMSAPHPEGLGARRAMQAALTSAGLSPDDIDYINLHGTATPSNDRAESLGVRAVFGPSTVCSSTKGATGHTLGAAGALEVVICAVGLKRGLLPGGVNTTQVDPGLGTNYLRSNLRYPARRILSNSFGFGGTNCSVILGSAG
jgi:3-oxoacyl-[acyl-carrier-protein] synthase-1